MKSGAQVTCLGGRGPAQRHEGERDTGEVQQGQHRDPTMPLLSNVSSHWLSRIVYCGATQVPVPRPSHGRCATSWKTMGYRSARTVNAGLVEGSSNRLRRVRTNPGLATAAVAPRMAAMTEMLYRCRQLHTGKSTRLTNARASIPVRDIVAAQASCDDRRADQRKLPASRLRP